MSVQLEKPKKKSWRMPQATSHQKNPRGQRNHALSESWPVFTTDNPLIVRKNTFVNKLNAGHSPLRGRFTKRIWHVSGHTHKHHSYQEIANLNLVST